MNTADIQEKLKTIACHVEEGDIELICKYASTCQNGEDIVDIGTAYGKSAAALAMVNPNVNVYSIDIEDSPLKLDKRPENLFFLRGDSRCYVWDREIAMMNIDGDHTYEGVKADLEHWMSYVKQGGYVVLHDYLMPEFGVKQAVDELLQTGEFEFLETGGISVAIRKV